MLQIARLQPKVSDEEKLADKSVKKMQKILRSVPERLGGGAMMCKSMIAICKGRKEEGRPGCDKSMRSIARMCFSRHGAIWAQQSLRQQMEWRQRASKAASARKAELGAEWTSLVAEIDLLNDRQEEAHSELAPVTMSSACWGEEELAVFGNLWQQENFRSPTHLATRRAGVGKAPLGAPPSRNAPVWQYVDPVMPRWASPLVLHRELLKGTVLIIERPDRSAEYWKLVFMVKAPYYLAMCALQRIADPAQDALTSDTASDRMDDAIYRFVCSYPSFATAADVTVGDADRLRILFRVVHEGGTRLASTSLPVDLDFILRGSQEDMVVEAGVPEESAPVDTGYDELLKVMPWLLHLDDQHGFSSTKVRAAGGASSSKGGGNTEDDDCELDEETMLAGLADMEKARRSLVEEDIHEGTRDFHPKIRGGPSQMLKSGEAVHAAQGASNNNGSAWAKRHGLQVSFKATYSEYGVANSNALVRSWCHRMQHFYDVEVAARAGLDFVFSQDVLDAYIEPTELTALAVEKSTSLKTTLRIELIRKIPFR